MRTNECDECQAPLADNAGGLCFTCALRYDNALWHEWWDE